MKRPVFLEDFDFDTATEEHNPCAGIILSRKEPATQSSLLFCYPF